jgi:hypothetical protein
MAKKVSDIAKHGKEQAEAIKKQTEEQRRFNSTQELDMREKRNLLAKHHSEIANYEKRALSIKEREEEKKELLQSIRKDLHVRYEMAKSISRDSTKDPIRSLLMLREVYSEVENVPVSDHGEVSDLKYYSEIMDYLVEEIAGIEKNLGPVLANVNNVIACWGDLNWEVFDLETSLYCSIVGKEDVYNHLVPIYGEKKATKILKEKAKDLSGLYKLKAANQDKINILNSCSASNNELESRLSIKIDGDNNREKIQVEIESNKPERAPSVAEKVIGWGLLVGSLSLYLIYGWLGAVGGVVGAYIFNDIVLRKIFNSRYKSNLEKWERDGLRRLREIDNKYIAELGKLEEKLDCTISDSKKEVDEITKKAAIVIEFIEKHHIVHNLLSNVGIATSLYSFGDDDITEKFENSSFVQNINMDRVNDKILTLQSALASCPSMTDAHLPSTECIRTIKSDELLVCSKEFNNMFESLRNGYQKSVNNNTSTNIDDFVETYNPSNNEIERITRKAEQGDPSSQYIIGNRYYFGNGVNKDIDFAVAWLRKAADQGIDKAQFLLGHLYLRGKEIDKDLEKARVLIKSAAEQGHASAQDTLGDMYCTGEGVIRDIPTGHMWYILAGENGVKIKEDLQYYRIKDVSKKDIEKAKIMAIEWKQSRSVK